MDISLRYKTPWSGLSHALMLFCTGFKVDKIILVKFNILMQLYSLYYCAPLFHGC